MRFGCHVSIAGGLYKAIERGVELGCEAIQIFASNPRGWRVSPLRAEDVARFKEARADSGISVVAVHSTYLVNLASPNPEIREKSYSRFREDLERAGQIGAEYMIIHPGSHGGAGLETGFDYVAEAFNRFRQESEVKSMVLLEIEAGGGTEIGGSWDNLCRIRDRIEAAEEWVGLCLDTCHSFAAGYDLRTPEGWRAVLDTIKERCGLAALKLIHANDATGELGDRLDRHSHIGHGRLGLAGFAAMMEQPELHGLPVILETPEDELGNFATNLETLRQLWRTRQKQGNTVNSR